MEFIISGDALFSSDQLRKTIDPALVSKLKNADAVFTNAEFITPRLETAPAAGRGFQTSVRPKLLDEFVDLNIHYVSFANNHTGDYGIEGILDTLVEARGRGIVPLGIAENLYDARKPVFINHQDCRIAIITIDVTRSEVFAAVDARNGIPARLGVNPLRWSRKYVVSKEDLKTLEEISKKIGIQKSMITAKKIELWKDKNTQSQLDFGSFYEGYLSFIAGDEPKVATSAKKEDIAAIISSIQDAKKRSDFVFVNLHTHEGENEDWYGDYPPTFIEEFAEEAIDAGANVVFGHGAHFTRGIQLYKEGVIFFNLGSLLMEFEAGESLLSAEMNEAYGYPLEEVPSTLHSHRVKDEQGQWHGFYGHQKFSQNFIVSFQLKRGQASLDFEIIPIDLQLTHDFITKRGLPIIADHCKKQALVERLNKISNKRYQTQIFEENYKLKVKKVN